MYVCMYICMYVCVCVCVCARARARACVRDCVRLLQEHERYMFTFVILLTYIHGINIFHTNSEVIESSDSESSQASTVQSSQILF